MWLIILTITLVILAYLKVKKSYKYWEEKGVPYVKPFLVFGNLASGFFQTKAFAYITEDLYNAYPDKRYVGIYQLLTPSLMIRDPDLIKQITIKDFVTFPNRRALATGDADPLMQRSLISMEFKDGWHDMRSTLSPSFTSSKMRAMFGLMQECAKDFINYLKEQGDFITIELKDAFSRYGNDVISSTAFGVTCNSLKEKENEIYLMGKDAGDFTGLRVFKIIGFMVAPSLMKLFKIPLLSKNVYNFFGSIIKETIKVREEKQIVRPDMVYLLMEARKGRLKNDDQDSVPDTGFAVAQQYDSGKTHKRKKAEIEDDDITAQALSFFLGGADTSSTLMSYASYELAINPDVQNKLHAEIDKVVEEAKGQITYEALMGMKYLDNVVSETLRKHPPSPLSDRVATKPYRIQSERPGEKPVHLEKGSLIWLPTYAIQHDPKYYPDPEKFDPERFSDANKRNINPFTFIAFGSGPRNCIGSRFALLETKLIIAELLRHFEIVPVEKTVIPIRHSPKNAAPLPAEGFWLGLISRQT